jgi:hypothetical protein
LPDVDGIEAAATQLLIQLLICSSASLTSAQRRISGPLSPKAALAGRLGSDSHGLVVGFSLSTLMTILVIKALSNPEAAGFSFF